MTSDERHGPAQLATDAPPSAAKPIDATTIQATIDRALRTGTGRLVMDELTELEALLRGHINLLLPDAEAAADRLWRGSLTWYQCRARLDGIGRQMKQSLGDRPLAAHVQVTQLARDCQWLLVHHRHREGS
ncbi:DUF6415 family natural product biosynthesis protein [Streptomyces sp. NPDC002055]|uniref:DUF6415 family natural product biosynthesis protein n=1 Tax=Streptomyces sp. NPDC002055 TaxID=3154534 RepID=UPI00332049F4